MSKRKFETEKDFQDKFDNYIQYCIDKERFANIAGFCVYCDMHRDTFYEQDKIYPDTFKKVQSALEDTTLNDKNTTRSIFYLKNKFGYADKVDVNAKVEIPKLEHFFTDK